MNKDRTDEWIFVGLLFIPVSWAGLLFAPYIDKGLVNALPELTTALNNPFSIHLCKNTIKTVAVFILIYIVGVAIYISTRRNTRINEEYGSAKWGSARELNKKVRDKKNIEQNKILTQHTEIALNRCLHDKNLFTLIIGGPGSGKTRNYCYPNVMQCNCSYVILDPKGETLRAMGNLLKKEGYVIKILDLKDLEKSHGYNPFKYLQSEIDIMRLVTNLIKNTTKKDSMKGDQFWEMSEITLLRALCFYLHYEAPEYEQNFEMLMEMLHCAKVKEDDEDYASPLDLLFNELKESNPGSLAWKQYDIFRSGAGKTLKSIIISLGVRLSAFDSEALIGLTKYDELELDKIADRKTALFCVIPDNDDTYNFLIGILYTQLFQILFRYSDKRGGGLPIPVHFIMDEFANVSIPDDFEKLLSTMRSRDIFVSIILQNLTQLKGIFKNTYESIIGDCDQILYLGSNEKPIHKWVSELLGTGTIDTKNTSKSTGHGGNYSESYQKIGRVLYTPDEVGRLDDRNAILYVKGSLPVVDKKYDLMKHKNIKYTVFGEGDPYVHGITDVAIDDWQNIILNEDGDYELYSEEDLEKYFEEEEKKEKQTNEK